jgi:hypothetical protein
VVGNHAYVASYGADHTREYAGLTIIDISDPTEPLTVDLIDTYLDSPTDVYVAGDHAYVTSQNNDSLVIFDVSDLNNVLADGVYSDTTLLDGPSAVHVRDSYAYVLAENAGRLAALDISNPTQISLVDSITTTLARPTSLFLSGDYVYVAYAGAPATAENCGLAVFDVSDPSDIQVLSEINMSDSVPEPEKPVAINGNGQLLYVANEGHDSVTIYEVNHLAAPVVSAGNVQADYLEANENARVNHNLSVGDGLNVGPGGALIEGQLSVAGLDNNYILGNLSLGAAGIVLSDTEKTQILYPTQQLDVHGDTRFRINENHSLIMSSPPIKGAYLDFTTNNFGAYYTPTARIEFSVPDPFTGTTHTTEVKILTQSASDTQVRGRMTIGEEISFYNVDPGEPNPDLNLRTTITLTQSGDVLPGVDNIYLLGDGDHRWKAVYAANGTIQTSDIRWKENITELPYGLEQVKQLQPVAFTWVDGSPQDVHYGLVAQEVAEVLPELVSGGDSPDAPLGMNYSELVPVLIRAVQEQQVEIETQEAQIASLEARLSALEDVSGRQRLDTGAFNLLSWTGIIGLMVGIVVMVRNKQ